MFCPYACNTKQVTQQHFDYEDRETGMVETFRETVFVETKSDIMCQKGNCGAWTDGECHYKENC